VPQLNLKTMAGFSWWGGRGSQSRDIWYRDCQLKVDSSADGSPLAPVSYAYGCAPGLSPARPVSRAQLTGVLSLLEGATAHAIISCNKCTKMHHFHGQTATSQTAADSQRVTVIRPVARCFLRGGDWGWGSAKMPKASRPRQKAKGAGSRRRGVGVWERVSPLQRRWDLDSREGVCPLTREIFGGLMWK